MDSKPPPRLNNNNAASDMSSQQTPAAQNDSMEGPRPVVAGSRRFRRQEWDYSLLNKINEKNIGKWGVENCREEIKRLFERELSKSDFGRMYHEGDDFLYGAMNCTTQGIPEDQDSRLAAIMKCLWLRAKIQSSFLSVLMDLNRSGVVSLEGLEKPMKLWRITDKTVKKVRGALFNFERICEIGPNWITKFPHFGDLNGWFSDEIGYAAPMCWLATVIVRGALTTDLDVIMHRIEEFGEFGALNRQKLERYIEKYRPEVKGIVRNPNANLSSGDLEPGKRHHDSLVMAFWLPYDMGLNITAEDACRAFDDEVFIPLEDLCFRFFGLPKDLNLAPEMLPASLLRLQNEVNGSGPNHVHTETVVGLAFDPVRD